MRGTFWLDNWPVHLKIVKVIKNVDLWDIAQSSVILCDI